MNWLKRAKQGIKTWRKKTLPDGLWDKCPACGEILYKKEIIKLLSICPKCFYHFRITAPEYLDIITDPGSFEHRSYQGVDAHATTWQPVERRDTVTR